MDRRLVMVGILLFSLYSASTRFSLDGYELEYVLSAMNVYHGNGPAMAAGFSDCPGIWPTDGESLVYPRQNLLQTYLSVPFYALGAVLVGERPTIEGRGGVWDLPWGPVGAVSLLNPLCAAFLAMLVGLICRELGVQSPGHAVVAVIYGVTTMNWHYGALGMEVVQTTVLMFAIWAAMRYRFTGKTSWMILSILLLPALANTKKISFLFVFPVVIYLIWSLSLHRKKTASFAAAAVILAAVTGTAVMTWSMIVRFHAEPNLFPHFLRSYLSGGFKTADLVFALLVSPGEGLLIFNPILWFAVPAWPVFYKEYRAESRLFLGIFLLLLLIIRIIPYVLIDEEWGPRYLFVILPMAVIAGAGGLLKNRAKTARIFFVTVLIASLVLQWLSSMYLGFQMLDIPIKMGVSDYMLTVFTPSLSQIGLTVISFTSYMHYLITGESLVLQHRRYHTYTGKGGSYTVLRQDLDGLDRPSGGLFIVRWVLSEKGHHRLTPGLTLFLKFLFDSIILGALGWMSIKALKEYRIRVHQAESL
jgi:hypothetical protein